MADFFYESKELIVLFAILAFMLAASEAGFRLGRRAQPRTSEKTKAQISVLEGSILGVLGLLLGFTMTMAVSRFEMRRQLVLEEANAIGTSYLRTQLLPAPESTEVGTLLRRYVDARVHFGEAGDDPNRLNTAREQCLQLQNEFWPRVIAYAQKDPNPVKSGLLLQSLNQAIDMESARWMALHNHVPGSVIYVNALVALMAAIMVGYTFGLEGHHHLFSTCLVSIAIVVVLGVILDLDRPSRGFINVGQRPMIDLQRQLSAPNH